MYRLLGRPDETDKGDSDAKTTTQILQVLLTFASNPKGVAGLWAVEDLSPLLEMSNQPPLVMDIVKYMTIYGCAQPELRSPIAEKLDSIVSVFSLAFRHTKTNVLLQFLAEVLPQVTPEVKYIPVAMQLLTDVQAAQP